MLDDSDIHALMAQGLYRQAFELLVPRFGDRILRLAMSFSSDRAMAEDITQEVLLRIWRALPAYRRESSLSTWIFAITRNTSLSAFAKNSLRQALSLSEPAILAKAERRAIAVATPTLHRADVEKLVQALPEHLRHVTALFYLEGKSYEQVAVSLGLPLGTVKTNLHRARKELLKALSPKETA